MSDTKETPTSELRVLVTGSDKKAPVIADKTGKEWKLLPLDLNDLIEYKELTGTDLFSEEIQNIGPKQIMTLMFLSLRKTDCSDADLDARRFKFPAFASFLRMFDLKAFVQSANILADLLAISGLAPDPQKAGPQEANQ